MNAPVKVGYTVRLLANLFAKYKLDLERRKWLEMM